MDTGFTEEQELLRESARRFLESECATQFVRRKWRSRRRSPTSSGRSSPSRAGSASSIPRSQGGSGLGLVDLVVLMEEMGRAVMPGPFLSTVLLGGAAIAEAGSPAQRRIGCRGSPKAAQGGAGLDRAQSALGCRRHRLAGAESAAGCRSVRHQAFCRRCASRRHHRRRRAQRDGSDDGGRRQPISGAERRPRAPSRCCRRSTRPANSARSRSTMSLCPRRIARRKA